MKVLICLFLISLLSIQGAYSQRKVQPKSREQKAAEKRAAKKEHSGDGRSDTELRWDPRQIPSKSKGIPEVSAWHTGTAGIIASDAAEISLFNPSRIGFSKKTEWLFRIAEEPFLPNVGLKHHWLGKKRFFLSSEHTLYYTYPGLKILQKTGFKDLVPDSVHIGQGIAMRHELMFSWLMNPSVWGCPDPPSEKILTLRAGTEFYIGFGDTEVRPFDYGHSFYHTQLLDGKVLYYGGLQFDSYFANRFHYSVNGLFYSIDFKKEYAAEANARLTYFVSRHLGISAACKVACMNITGQTKLAYVPLLDLTYLIRPGRATIRHGLYKRRRGR